LDKLKKSGRSLVGACPIHKGTNTRQFSVNLEKNVFICFGNCQSGGNVLNFVEKMEKVSLREAALLLKKWFLESGAPAAGTKTRSEPEKTVISDYKASDQGKLVNPPLKFELKTLNPDHPFFAERGILPETVKYFGLGFCSKGLLKGLIAIPIHNQAGQLVAYAGRWPGDPPAEEPKYKLPPGFAKAAVVYNLNRQKKGEEVFILVESFLSVFILHQAGFPNALALMGSSLSEEQEALIVAALGPGGKAALLFDADDSGRLCTQESLSRLSGKVFVKAIDISPFAKKPHQLTPEQIKALI
jgi:DNA primase